MTPNERMILGHLAQSDAMNALKALARELINDWNLQIPTGSTEFEYLRSSISRDERQVGIRAFMSSIESMANDGLKIKPKV